MKTAFVSGLLFFSLLIVAICLSGCTASQPPVAAVTTTPTATPEPTAVQTIAACGIENCHGIPIQCGANVATACSSANVASDLSASDQCRKYASCQVVSGTCQAVTDTKYDKCVSCIRNCQNSFPNNPNQEIDCSQNC